MRVVLDTNVFVSSFFGGHSRRIIELWAAGELTLCVSSDVLAEYVEVMQRMGLENRPEMRDILSLFKSGRQVVFAARTPCLRVVANDPDDDKFIACAVALDAEVVISGDRHLTALGRYVDIPILTPARFVSRFGRSAVG
jgi:putative PIN family toxin of toxin-antitoxin system